ncbi:hypothetical protein BH09VER1_BH09VER1_14170 [soil metagenome]
MSSSNPKNVLGPILRQLRERHGLSHIEVAERYAQTGFECSEERIIAIENQQEPIKDYEVLVFERIFGGTEITEFFSRELEARFGRKESWPPL